MIHDGKIDSVSTISIVILNRGSPVDLLFSISDHDGKIELISNSPHSSRRSEGNETKTDRDSQS